MTPPARCGALHSERMRPGLNGIDVHGASAYPMVRATLRDIVPLAWRISVEFTRPARSWRPILPCTAVVFPVFLGVAAMPGVYHWERKAILGLARRNEDTIRHAAAAILIIVLMLAELGLLRTVVGNWANAIWGGSLAAGIGLPRLIGRWIRSPTIERADGRPHREIGKPFFLLRAPPCDWVGSVAAARPGSGLDAIAEVFFPHVRATVPRGQTIGIVAANKYLAAKYRALGFEQVGASPLTLRATI